MVSGEISYYNRYVDDILITFDQNKSNEVSIANHMNKIIQYWDYKLKQKNYLDISNRRHSNNSLLLCLRFLSIVT